LLGRQRYGSFLIGVLVGEIGVGGVHYALAAAAVFVGFHVVRVKL
jgi:hypothetical protein